MRLKVKEIAVFGMLGALMFASKLVMDALPNVHLLGVFTIALTLVYRKKALYPISVFVLLLGVFNGFAMWWIPHLYVWTVLWAVIMLLPQNIPSKYRAIVYMAICALHGLLYGILYAPAQAVMYHMSFKAMISWIIAGLPFDAVHGVSNFFCGLLIIPLEKAMRLADKVHN